MKPIPSSYSSKNLTQARTSEVVHVCKLQEANATAYRPSCSTGRRLILEPNPGGPVASVESVTRFGVRHRG